MTQTSPVVRDDVPEAFDEIAATYDRMVGMSPGYHAQLRRSADVLVDAVAARPVTADRPLRLVDLGCGSGASTRALVDALAARGLAADVVGVDGSAGMLGQARAKSWPEGVRFVNARAEELVDRADLAGDGGLDGVLAAYLVRNVADRDALCVGLRDALAPGGALVLHEYSVAGNRAATAVWTATCLGVVVPLGWVTSRRTRLYRYLWRSVLDFDSVAQLLGRLERAGFVQVRATTPRGWQRGIIHTVSGRRPLPEVAP
ncbi:MAG TPA: class I SAM-dependent methyltransferase [Dermatophilaceae bacterium]|nr:class I SAM-dependent methyltransferase [Dermatophilaceae bacterium]